MTTIYYKPKSYLYEFIIQWVVIIGIIAAGVLIAGVCNA